MEIKPVPPLRPFSPLRKVEQREAPPHDDRDQRKEPEDGAQDAPPSAVDDYA